MSTIAHDGLTKFLGADKFFKYGSSRVRAKLPAGHPLNNGFSGTCKWQGKVSDHVLNTPLDANEMAKCYAGGAAAVYPASGERILIEVLPSCTCIFDLCPSYSKGNAANKFLNASSGAQGAFITDASTDPMTTSAVSICESTAPAAGNNAVFPPMDIYIGRLNSPLADVADINTFQAILVFSATDGLQPEIGMLGDTGGVDDQWVLWGEVTADVPANSYARVDTHINKGTRF